MPVPPIKVFVSYVPSEEENGIDEIDYILSQLQNQVGTDYRIEYWFDRYVDDDRIFTKQAKEKLLVADVILLLICPEYFRSPYILRHEKPLIEKRFHEQHKKGKEVQLIPIILAELAYARQWVFPFQVETIPRNYRYPILAGRRSWEDVLNLVYYRLDSLFEELHEELEEQAKNAAWRQEKLEGMKKRKLPVIYWVNPIPVIICCTLLLMIHWGVKTAQLKQLYPGLYETPNNYTDTRFLGPSSRCLNTPCPHEE